MWEVIRKGDMRARRLADRHYTRQKPGTPSWARPGYNFVLYHASPQGEALWCWWRPKWEDGRPGTCRKDGLRVIECTMFRREGITPLASECITAAVAALDTPAAYRDLHLDTVGYVDGLLTGIGTSATKRGRATSSLPGACYRHAGWVPSSKPPGGRADVWLEHPTWFYPRGDT